MTILILIEIPRCACMDFFPFAGSAFQNSWAGVASLHYALTPTTRELVKLEKPMSMPNSCPSLSSPSSSSPPCKATSLQLPLSESNLNLVKYWCQSFSHWHPFWNTSIGHPPLAKFWEILVMRNWCIYAIFSIFQIGDSDRMGVKHCNMQSQIR